MFSAEGDRQMLPRQTMSIRLANRNLLDGQFLLEFFEVMTELLVGFGKIDYRATSMKNSCVIFATNVCSDTCQGRFRHFFGEVHRDLTCLNNLALARFGFKHFNWEVKVVANHFLNVFDGDFTSCTAHKFVYHLLGEV